MDAECVLSLEERKAIAEEALQSAPRIVDGEGCPSCGARDFHSLAAFGHEGEILHVCVCPCGEVVVFEEGYGPEPDVLHIITPCMRPQNLQAVAESLTRLGPIPHMWWVVGDEEKIKAGEIEEAVANLVDVKAPLWVMVPNPGSHTSSRQRNYALDAIPLNRNNWVYFLDDDNTLHPDFGRAFFQLTTSSSAWGFVVGCELETGEQLVAGPDKLKMGEVDIAQCCFSRVLISDTRFCLSRMEEDNVFINAVIATKPNRVAFVSGMASYHNRLVVDV